MGVLEPSGRWLVSFNDFKSALEKNKSMLSQLGEIHKTSPLRDPANGDFRPSSDGAVPNEGVKVFVPWALSGVVGEWNFYHTGDNPGDIIDCLLYTSDAPDERTSA